MARNTGQIPANSPVTSQDVQLTSGEVTASGSLTLVNGTWNDVPGATVTFTPAVASIVVVTASFVFDMSGGNQTNVNGSSIGALAVDGTRQTRQLKRNFGLGLPAGTGWVYSDGTTISESWRIPLSAASHTLKLQAELVINSGTVVATCPDAHFIYQLFAS